MFDLYFPIPLTGVGAQFAVLCYIVGSQTGGLGSKRENRACQQGKANTPSIFPECGAAVQDEFGMPVQKQGLGDPPTSCVGQAPQAVPVALLSLQACLGGWGGAASPQERAK